MAKPILYYALARRGYFRQGFEVIAVTSETRSQVYGRDEQDGATHVAARDILHRFPEGTPRDWAMASRNRADAETQRHRAGIEKAERDLATLREFRDRSVLEAARGVAPAAPSPDTRSWTCRKPWCACGTAKDAERCDDRTGWTR